MAITVEYRRAQVATFWAVAAAAVFGATAGLTSAFGAGGSMWTTAAVAVGALLAPGLVWPSWFEKGVWLWNGTARRAVIGLRRYVIAVCYMTIVSVVALAGSPMRDELAKGVGSRWRPRSRSLRDVGDELHGLTSFARAPGNRWALILVPFVFLLALCRDEREDAELPGSTYTLY